MLWPERQRLRSDSPFATKPLSGTQSAQNKSTARSSGSEELSGRPSFSTDVRLPVGTSGKFPLHFRKRETRRTDSDFCPSTETIVVAHTWILRDNIDCTFICRLCCSWVFRFETITLNRPAIFFSRWETDWIHPQLHSLYFQRLVDILVNRAELIGAERRMMKVRGRCGVGSWHFCVCQIFGD